MKKNRNVGWQGESRRHSLARKGIKTSNGLFSRKKDVDIEYSDYINEVQNASELIKEHSELPKEYRESELFIDRRLVQLLIDMLNFNKDYYNINYFQFSKWDVKVGQGILHLNNGRKIVIYLSQPKDRLYESKIQISGGY